LVFFLSVGSTFATIAGLFSTNPGLELLALKPPPPTFGVLLGFGAPGTQEVSGTRFRDNSFAFILISSCSTSRPGLLE
jgi:hypothetical protein